MALRWHDEDVRLRHRRMVGRWLPLAMAVLGSLVVLNSVFPASMTVGLSLVAMFWGSYIAAELRGMMAPPLVITRGSDPAARVVDEETGLGNRLQLKESLARELARARQLGATTALAVFEVQVLGWDPLDPRDLPPPPGRFVAKALRESLRPMDIPLRLDNEHFAAILVECDRATAEASITRLRSALRGTPYGRSPDGRALYVTVWPGVVPLDDRTGSVDQCIDEAISQAERARSQRATSAAAASAGRTDRVRRMA